MVSGAPRGQTARIYERRQKGNTTAKRLSPTIREDDVDGQPGLTLPHRSRSLRPVHWADESPKSLRDHALDRPISARQTHVKGATNESSRAVETHGR